MISPGRQKTRGSGEDFSKSRSISLHIRQLIPFKACIIASSTFTKVQQFRMPGSCGVPLLACLHENAVVNNTPAENQLGEIPCGHVVSVSEE